MNTTASPTSEGSAPRPEHRGVLCVLSLLALAVALVFLYLPSWPMVVRAWSRPDYTHGPLVPFISLFLAWQQRDRLRATAVAPNPTAGLALLLLGILALMLGRAGSVLIVELASFPVVASGLVLTILGSAYLRTLILPIAYLLFMVPLPDLFLGRIHWYSQNFTAKYASLILPLIGIPVLRQQQFLTLPNVILEITGGCSGIKYLISIIAIAIPLAHLTQKTRLQKIAVVVAAILIGVAANIARIVLIGIWAHNFGPQSIHGPRHIFQGMFISIVGYVFLFLIAVYAIASRRKDPTAKDNPPMPESRGTLLQHWADSGRALVLSVVCVALLVGTGAYLALHKIRSVPLRVRLDAVPQQIGPWRGRDGVVENQVLRVPGASAELLRKYTRDGGGELTLYVAYLDSQQQERELVYYTFQDLYDATEETALDWAGGRTMVNKAVIKGYQGSSFSIYWYDMGARTMTKRHLVKVYSALQSLVRGSNNGALVLLSAEAASPQDGEALTIELKEFAREVYPLVQGFIRPETASP